MKKRFSRSVSKNHFVESFKQQFGVISCRRTVSGGLHKCRSSNITIARMCYIPKDIRKVGLLSVKTEEVFKKCSPESLREKA